jgi:hypothetical protein
MADSIWTGLAAGLFYDMQTSTCNAKLHTFLSNQPLVKTRKFVPRNNCPNLFESNRQYNRDTECSTWYSSNVLSAMTNEYLLNTPSTPPNTKNLNLKIYTNIRLSRLRASLYDSTPWTARCLGAYSPPLDFQISCTLFVLLKTVLRQSASLAAHPNFSRSKWYADAFLQGNLGEL